MKKQQVVAAKKFGEFITYIPKQEMICKVIADKKVDVLINATPDHWHAPGTWLAVQADK